MAVVSCPCTWTSWSDSVFDCAVTACRAASAVSARLVSPWTDSVRRASCEPLRASLMASSSPAELGNWMPSFLKSLANVLSSDEVID